MPETNIHAAGDIYGARLLMESHMSKTGKVQKFTSLITRCMSVAFLMTLLPIALLGCATPSTNPVSASTADPHEEIYVLRSLREARTATSNWCTPERIGSSPTARGFMIEDRYTMWSVTVQPKDGRIADAKAGSVGELHACFGSTTDSKVVSFYTEGQIAGLPFTGRGDYLNARVDFPEKGITTFRCYLNLADLPAPYVDGSLATNTINSKAVLGAVSDPPGYVQASIATIRLWRSR